MKTVIYKENGVYKTTTEENYNRNIRNAREIHTMYDFESAEEIIEYYTKWFNCNREDFIVMYNIYGKQYDTNGLREGYETITGIAYDNEIYTKPLTDEEIYQYLLDALKE